MYMKITLFPIFLFSFLCNFIYAQTDPKTHSFGFLSGYASQKFFSVDLNRSPLLYYYSVYFFDLQYQKALFVKKDFERKKSWHWNLLIQPQISASMYQYSLTDTSQKKGFEMGLNAGVIVRRFVVSDKLGFFIGGTTGPFYVSGLPIREHPGFIFCDTGFIGLIIKLAKSTFLDTRLGFRHLSNAGLEWPNGGVNDLVSGGGILIVL